MKSVSEAVLTALMAEDSKLLVQRLSLCNLPLENLVNGIPISVEITDLELLKKYIEKELKQYTNTPRRITDIISAYIENYGDIKVKVSYEYFYKRTIDSPEERSSNTITIEPKDYIGNGLKVEFV